MKKLNFVFVYLLATVINAQSLDLTMFWYSGTSLVVGSKQEVTWESSGVDSIKIEYSIDSAKTWIIIEESYPAELGTYEWIIPNTPSNYCKIKVSDANNNLYFSINPIDNEYDWYFTIYSGNQWELIPTPTNETLTNVRFSDELNGVAWSDKVLLSTKDGGNSWEKINEFEQNNVYFVDSENGWCLDNSDSARILVTEDGGANWKTEFVFPKGLAFFEDLIMLNKDAGMAVGLFEPFSSGYKPFTVVKIDDTPWEISEHPVEGRVDFDSDMGVGIEIYDGNWAVRSSIRQTGRFYEQTNDGGFSWKYIPYPDPIEYTPEIKGSYLYKFPKFFANNNKWNLSYSGSIVGYLHKFDSKEDKWNQVVYMAYLSLIHFQNEKIGWVLQRDDENFIHYTSDGGRTWQLQDYRPRGEYGYIRKIFSLDENRCLAVGENGAILKYNPPITNLVTYKITTELPQEESPIELTTGSFYEGKDYFVKPFTLPEEFEKQQMQINIFEGARFTLDEDAINESISLDIRFMGLDTDGGIINPIDNSPLFMFLGIEVTGEQSGVTDFEDFYYLNEGKKARIIIPRTEKFLKLLEELEIDETNISFAYVKGGEYFDEGLEWEIKDGEEGKVDSLCLYLDHFSKVIGGKNLLTSIENEEENIPIQFSLEQNYPNPFNPTTTINYEIPKVETHGHASVQIRVFDILGREVKTLVNEPKSAGRYEVSFDANNLTSGIYYYQIKAGEFVETKKMVLLK